MFIGHYSFPLAMRPVAPALRMLWLFLAAQFLDILFTIFVITRVEHLRIVPGFTQVNPYDLYDMAISHSLVTSLLWAIAFGLVARFAFRQPALHAVVLGATVFSHYVLDLFVHTPDLPLAPGSPVRF